VLSAEYVPGSIHLMLTATLSRVTSLSFIEMSPERASDLHKVT
jgi:hypothetical protein